jgi:hypothetical protein
MPPKRGRATALKASTAPPSANLPSIEGLPLTEIETVPQLTAESSHPLIRPLLHSSELVLVA